MEKIDKFFTFNSIRDVCDYIEHTPNCEKTHLSDETSARNSKFTGTESFDEALALLQKGDNELLKQILSSPNAPKLNAQRQRASGMEIYRSAYGFVPNIGAVMAGHPVNMYNCRRTFNKSTKVLNILYDISFPQTISTKEIFNASAKLFNYIYTKEAEGYRVNLSVCCFAYFRTIKQNILWKIKLKSSDEHFDLLRTAFPLCHPSFLRRICFALEERANIQAYSNGYGRALSTTLAKRLLQAQFPNFDYYNIETLDNIK